MSTSQFMKDLLKPLKHSDGYDDLNEVKKNYLLQESEDDAAIMQYWANIIQERSKPDTLFKRREMQEETQIIVANVEVASINSEIGNDLCLEETGRRQPRTSKAA